jgi:hypothetical protein
MTTQLETIARYTAGTVLGLGALGLAYPTLARPDVADVLALCVKSLAFSVTVAGSVAAVGYSAHRILEWRALRPPDMTAAAVAQFASSVAGGPGAPGVDLRELAAVASEARRADDDEDDELARWDSAVTKFALLGNLRGFGYRDLRGLVDRPGWEILKGLMVCAGVLENGAGTRPTSWAGEWCYTRFRIAVKWGRLELPYPPGEPPAVRWQIAGSGTLNTHAKHTSTQARRGVWEGGTPWAVSPVAQN